MAIQLNEKFLSLKWFKSYSLIVIGALFLASSFVFFITPYRFVPGGVFGISIVIHYLLGFPVGLTGLILNIPIAILGIKILGPKFGVKTVVGFTLTSIFIDLITRLWGETPLVENDALLASIFGGVTCGFGLGLIFRAKATSGGSDIIGMILVKYTRLPLGQMMILVDSCIVVIGLIAFQDWKVLLYSWIVIFITGKVIDVVLNGINFDKTLFIVTDKYDEVRRIILEDLDRGGTSFDAVGMFQGTPKKVIYTVVSPRELGLLKDNIRLIDPNAFMSVIDANEVLGKGFKSLSESGT
jgi:uncharacterized membrane-anchored protein YitT (DUF2179 family)